MQEKEIWSGTPSQVTNLGGFIIWGLLFWLVFPLFIILWKWLVVKNTKYKLTNERLTTQYGVLNQEVNELELYRVKDYTLERPFLLRMFSLGNIILETSDKTNPILIIEAIPNAEELIEKIRMHVEVRRGEKNVREVDFQ